MVIVLCSFGRQHAAPVLAPGQSARFHAWSCSGHTLAHCRLTHQPSARPPLHKHCGKSAMAAHSSANMTHCSHVLCCRADGSQCLGHLCLPCRQCVLQPALTAQHLQGGKHVPHQHGVIALTRGQDKQTNHSVHCGGHASKPPMPFGPSRSMLSTFVSLVSLPRHVCIIACVPAAGMFLSKWLSMPSPLHQPAWHGHIPTPLIQDFVNIQVPGASSHLL